jgi:4'-phosphopantetheinyl transferase EntD
VTSALVAAPLGLDLGASVQSAGFLLGDHEAVVAELRELSTSGLPERAVAKRRAEFLAGRFAAQQALKALGFATTPGRNEDGSPRWPQAVVGSITHGAGRALCAVAHQAELRSLGIDVERLLSPTAKEELMARICGADERTLMAKELPASEQQVVTFAFSAKESLYKCLYPLMGRFMDFSAARVVAASGAEAGGTLRGELLLELAEDWSPEFRQGRRFQAPFLASDSHVETAVLLAI